MAQATSVRFDDTTDKLLKAYIASHNISKSDFIKQAVAAQLEDWSDVQAADLAHQEWKQDNFKTMGWQDTLKDLELDDE